MHKYILTLKNSKVIAQKKGDSDAGNGTFWDMLRFNLI
jgi:hypothetical protein